MRLPLLAAALLGGPLAAGASVFHASPLALRDAKWLAAGSGLSAALTTVPAECFAPPAAPAAATAAEAGRLIFRTPMLLGGLAARTGMSCQSCHVNGHDNPRFHIVGLSAGNGSFDVSNSLFSRRRGDDAFNPIPIPSLLKVLDTKSTDFTVRKQQLAPFIRGVIVDEFDGAPPAPSVFEALLSYVASLDRRACPPRAALTVGVDDDLTTIRRGALALRSALADDETALADFLIVALRHQLGNIDTRFDRPGLEAVRAALGELSQQLAALRELLARKPAAVPAALQRWQTQLDAVAPLLHRQAGASYYVPEVIDAVLDKGHSAAAGAATP